MAAEVAAVLCGFYQLLLCIFDSLQSLTLQEIDSPVAVIAGDFFRMQPSHPATLANVPDKRTELRLAALEYHQFPTPGKLAIPRLVRRTMATYADGAEGGFLGG